LSLEVKLSDDLSYHFSNKNLHQFWKTWNYKCGIYISKNVNITGCTDDVGIASAFVEDFENVLTVLTTECVMLLAILCEKNVYSW